MTVSLKDLKENKGQKKEFSFLKSLSEVFEEKYSSIKDSFTKESLREACEEVMKDYSTVAIYNDPTTLLLAGAKDLRVHSYADNKKEDGTFKLTFDKRVMFSSASRYNDVINYIERGNNTYRYNDYRTLLEELYVVTDEVALQEYAIELLIIQEEEQKIKVAEKEAKRREETKDKLALTAKYEFPVSSNQGLEIARFLETFEKNDPKASFKSLETLLNDHSDCCGCCDCDCY